MISIFFCPPNNKSLFYKSVLSVFPPRLCITKPRYLRGLKKVTHTPCPFVTRTTLLWGFTSCCGSGPPPPGSCLGRGLWYWGTWCWWGISFPPLWKSAACGRGRVSAGSSRTSPSLRRPAPSHACCAASATGNWTKSFRNVHICSGFTCNLDENFCNKLLEEC